MACITANLTSNGDIVSPFFQTTLSRKHVRQLFAYPDSAIGFIWTHFIILPSIMGVPDSMRISYKLSLLTASYALLKSTNCWCTGPLYSYFFSSIWRMQIMWSVIYSLHQNPHWWYPLISSAYLVNLDSRMLDRILNVVDKSDVPLLLLQSILSPF